MQRKMRQGNSGGMEYRGNYLFNMAERVGHSVFNKNSFIFSVLQFYAARFLYHIFVPDFHTDPVA